MTGGGSGIGAATVKAFAREGAAIVSLDIQEDAGQAVVAEAAGLGARTGLLRAVRHLQAGGREHGLR